MRVLCLSAATCAAVLLAGCDVDVKDPGRAPSVDVDVREGRAPDVEIRTPKVDIHTETKEVDVPTDVDIKTEKRTINVPDIDVTIPKEKDNE